MNFDLNQIKELKITFSNDNVITFSREEPKEKEYITIKDIHIEEGGRDEDNYIEFSDSSRITYSHEQDCCEWNYADFSWLDTEARDYKFEKPLKFEAHLDGFLFGDSRRMFFVPCYSDQNGYYTDEVDIYYNGKKVLETAGKMVGE